MKLKDAVRFAHRMLEQEIEILETTLPNNEWGDDKLNPMYDTKERLLKFLAAEYWTPEVIDCLTTAADYVQSIMNQADLSKEMPDWFLSAQNSVHSLRKHASQAQHYFD